MSTALLAAMAFAPTALAATGDDATQTPATAEATATEQPESDAGAQDKTTEDSGAKRSRSGRKSGRVNVISVAAEVLDMDRDEVKESVKTGKVGDLLIAADKVDEFKAAYLETAKTKLDEAVAAGSVTQAEADEKYAEYEQKMAGYDGTEHLCGNSDHSNMFNKEEGTSSQT